MDLGVNYLILAVLALLCCFQLADADVICKICDSGYPEGAQCSKIGKCINNTICYTDTFVNKLGEKIIHHGCRSVQECPNPHSRQSREDQFIQCSDCCSTNFCNARLCGLAPPAGFKECISCNSISSVDSCEDTELCGSTEDCMTEYRYAGSAKGTYKLGCESTFQCQIRDRYVKNFTRRMAPEEQPLDPQLTNTAALEHPKTGQLREAKQDTAARKRQIDDPMAICLSCCDYSYCNWRENCHTRQRAPAQQTTPSTP